MSKIMNLFRIWVIALLFSTLSLMPKAQAAESCVAADCDSLGYTQTLSECSGKQTLRCPFNTAKAYCNANANNCGEKFYGLSTCPCNATCVSCLNGGNTYQKSISCNQDYAFDSTNWNCKDDRCPAGSTRDAANCGKSGSKGWTLNSYPLPSSTTVTPCYACRAKSCLMDVYPYTSCDNNSCLECYPGDNSPRYQCTGGDVYYANKCMCLLVASGKWTSNCNHAKCYYNGRNGGYPCNQMVGKSVIEYPVSGITDNNVVVKKDDYTYYFNKDG